MGERREMSGKKRVTAWGPFKPKESDDWLFQHRSTWSRTRPSFQTSTNFPLYQLSLAIMSYKSIEESSSGSPGSSEYSSSEDENTFCANAYSTAEPLGQTSSPFFSLPLELRFQVYEYLLVPSKDGSCRSLYQTRSVNGDEHLEGHQQECLDCKESRSHHNCVPKNHGLITVSGSQRHASILRTCRLALAEAHPIFRKTPISLTVYGPMDESEVTPTPAVALKLFLNTTGLPRGYILPVLTLRFFPTHIEEDEFFGNIDESSMIATVIKQSGVKFDYLELITRYSAKPAYLDYTYDAEREILRVIEMVHHRPLKITWAHQNVSPKWGRRMARRCGRFFAAINQYFEHGIESGLPNFRGCPTHREVP